MKTVFLCFSVLKLIFVTCLQTFIMMFIVIAMLLSLVAFLISVIIKKRSKLSSSWFKKSAISLLQGVTDFPP